MLSNRIKLIASQLNKNDRVLDIGTDHALLPIYLVKNNLVELVDGCDISSSVLKNASDNLSRFNLANKINLYLSDGVKNVAIAKYNTLVICGMGFYTIRDILNNANLNTIDKMIIQTNNHHSDLRRFIVSKGFKINNELWICDQGVDYLIFRIERGSQVLSNEEAICGAYNPLNSEFYRKEMIKYKNLLRKIPTKFNDKVQFVTYVFELYKSYASREKTEGKSR